MRFIPRTSAVGAAVATGVHLAGVAAAAGVHAATAQAAGDEQPSLIEDYAYPNAAEILKTKNVILLRGDGHLLLVECTPPAAGTGRIVVESSRLDGGPNRLCFDVTGHAAWLALEVPAVYSIDGRRTDSAATVTAAVKPEDGEAVTVPVSHTNSTPVGTGSDPANKPTTLLELRVTR